MSDIAYPFAVSALGGTETTPTYSDLWRQRVLSVLCTPLGTRVMRPKFGSQPQAAMFEDYDRSDDVVRGMVGSAFADWLPRLTLRSVTVTPKDDASVVVDIWYELPNGEVDTATMSASASLYGAA